MPGLRLPRFPRFRFSLRALAVFVTLFCLWGGYHTNRGWKVRRVERMVGDEYGLIEFVPVREAQGVVASALVLYQRVVATLFHDREIVRLELKLDLSDEAVDAIIALPRLESFSLTSQNLLPRGHDELTKWLAEEHPVSTAPVRIPRGAVRRILARHRLKALALIRCFLSDDDMRAIAMAKEIESLNLGGSHFSEDAFAAVINLPRLRYFGFRDCPITGKRLNPNVGSSTLEFAQCEGAPVGCVFASFVGHSPSLANLIVLNPEIDDEFVRAIGPHPSIYSLNFQSSKLTDGCIDAFAAMPALVNVVLPRGYVTENGVHRLRAARPHLRVLLQ